MDLSLNNRAFQLGDEELLCAFFDPEYELPDAQEQISDLIKETSLKLEKCYKRCSELYTKLELLQAGSESLSTIILDSK